MTRHRVMMSKAKNNKNNKNNRVIEGYRTSCKDCTILRNTKGHEAAMRLDRV
jgi:hypothetical protein